MEETMKWYPLREVMERQVLDLESGGLGFGTQCCWPLAVEP